MVTGRTPYIIKRLYYSLFWNLSRKRKNIYITFDDGPTPVVTEQVLDILERYQAKATFFCIGRNVERHPEIFQKIIDKGHSVGNHTYSHLKGWITKNKDYYADIELASHFIPSRLFRPPYGKIKRSQLRHLRKTFRIIMWDVMSFDFKQSYSKEKCWRIVKRYTVPGSILVFHDSLKATDRMLYSLEKLLKEKSCEFEFKAI